MDQLFKQLQGVANFSGGGGARSATDDTSSDTDDEGRVEHPLPSDPEELKSELWRVQHQLARSKSDQHRLRKDLQAARNECAALGASALSAQDQMRKTLEQDRRTIQFLRAAIFPVSSASVFHPAAKRCPSKASCAIVGARVSDSPTWDKRSSSSGSATRTGHGRSRRGESTRSRSQSSSEASSASGGCSPRARLGAETATEAIDRAALTALEAQVESLQKLWKHACDERDSLQLKLQAVEERAREKRSPSPPAASRATDGAERLPGSQASSTCDHLIEDLRCAQKSISALEAQVRSLERSTEVAQREADEAYAALAQCVEQHKIAKEEWEHLRKKDAQLQYIHSMETELEEHRKQTSDLEAYVRRLRRKARSRTAPSVPATHSHADESAGAALLLRTHQSPVLRDEEAPVRSEPVDERSNSETKGRGGVSAVARDDVAADDVAKTARASSSIDALQREIEQKDREISVLHQQLRDAQRECGDREDGFDALYADLRSVREQLCAASSLRQELEHQVVGVQSELHLCETKLKAEREHVIELEENLQQARMAQQLVNKELTAANELNRQMRAQAATQLASSCEVAPSAVEIPQSISAEAVGSHLRAADATVAIGNAGLRHGASIGHGRSPSMLKQIAGTLLRPPRGDGGGHAPVVPVLSGTLPIHWNTRVAVFAVFFLVVLILIVQTTTLSNATEQVSLQRKYNLCLAQLKRQPE